MPSVLEVTEPVLERAAEGLFAVKAEALSSLPKVPVTG